MRGSVQAVGKNARDSLGPQTPRLKAFRNALTELPVIALE